MKKTVSWPTAAITIAITLIASFFICNWTIPIIIGVVHNILANQSENCDYSLQPDTKNATDKITQAVDKSGEPAGTGRQRCPILVVPIQEQTPQGKQIYLNVQVQQAITFTVIKSQPEQVDINGQKAIRFSWKLTDDQNYYALIVYVNNQGKFVKPPIAGLCKDDSCSEWQNP